jgi:hypothetical protein
VPWSTLDVEKPPYRLRIGQQLRRQRGEFSQDAAAVDLFQIEPAAQRVVMRQQPIDLVRQRVKIGKVHQADGAPADLVLIGRPDAAAGSADRRGRVGGFAQGIELAVQRQNQRDVFGDP